MKIKDFKQFINEYEIEGELTEPLKLDIYQSLWDSEDKEFHILVYTLAEDDTEATDKFRKYKIKWSRPNPSGFELVYNSIQHIGSTAKLDPYHQDADIDMDEMLETGYYETQPAWN